MMKNILVLVCDQLSATALKTYGNTYSHAPNIDRIAREGVVMEHAYCSCPLCQPSRASFWTSRHPHQTRVLSNLPDQGFPSLSGRIPTMGQLFSQAGYQCLHFGKTHDYGALEGFQVIPSREVVIPRANPAIKFDYETYLDIDTTRKSVEYLKSSPKEPFLMVADLQNPHNICSYIGENSQGYMPGFPLSRNLPPLPANYAFDDMENRPAFIQYLCCAHRRQRQVCGWDEDDFQHYLYAYYHYLSMVDLQIGQILEALEEGGRTQDTLVAFLADHGEAMAAHQLVTKYGAFYEESNRVPLFFSGKDMAGSRRVGGVCSLLDLLPTLLDYAGIESPAGLAGISLLPQLKGEKDATGEAYVSAQWHDEFQGYTVPGRMICDEQWKYIRYLEEDGEELYNMEKDRLEKKNLAGQPEYLPVLNHYRQLLNTHVENTHDNFFSLKTIGTEHYRHHPPGRQNHKGRSAVELYAERLKRK